MSLVEGENPGLEVLEYVDIERLLSGVPERGLLAT